MVTLQFFCRVKSQAQSWSCQVHSFCFSCSFLDEIIQVVSALCLLVALLCIRVNFWLLVIAVLFLELKLANMKCVLF